MGNSCCSHRGRRHIRPSEVSTVASLDKVSVVPKNSHQSSRKISDVDIEEKSSSKNSRQFSKVDIEESHEILTLERGKPVTDTLENDTQEEIVDLDFSFTEFVGEKNLNKAIFSEMFSEFKNKNHKNKEEKVEGFLIANVKERGGELREFQILISNIAVYLLNRWNCSEVNRRVPFDNFIFILVDKQLKGLIVHLASNELLGDLWIMSENKIESVYRCFQSNYFKLKRKYIPSCSDSDEELSSSFNNFLFSRITEMLNKKYEKVTSIIVSKGKVVENIIKFQTFKGIFRGHLESCVIVLTSLAIYALTINFKFICRYSIEDFVMILTSRDFEKVILVKMNGEKHIFLLDSNFVAEIQKAYLALKNKRLKLNLIDHLEISDFLHNTQ